MAGEVIGIVSQNISQSGGSEGLGFVVTIDSAKMLLVPRKVFWARSRAFSTPIVLRRSSMFHRALRFSVKTVAENSTAWTMGLQGSDGVIIIGGKEILVGWRHHPLG